MYIYLYIYVHIYLMAKQNKPRQHEKFIIFIYYMKSCNIYINRIL